MNSYKVVLGKTQVAVTRSGASQAPDGTEIEINIGDGINPNTTAVLAAIKVCLRDAAEEFEGR